MGIFNNNQSNSLQKGALLLGLLNKSVGNPENHLKNLSQLKEIIEKWKKGEKLNKKELYYIEVLKNEIPPQIVEAYLSPYLNNKALKERWN